MNGHSMERDVIDAAKDVVKCWTDEGVHSLHLSTALAMLHKKVSKLRMHQEGRREEVGRDY